LVAVSKTHPAERIRLVLEAGHRIFGENRVQEAKAKWPQLRAEFSGIELHLIGPLQSNKAREALELFDVIHSLDRPRLAEALRAEIDRTGRAPVLFIQVNTGEEPQKAGVAPQDAPAFIAYCREELRLPVEGLMCIPPAKEATFCAARQARACAWSVLSQHGNERGLRARDSFWCNACARRKRDFWRANLTASFSAGLRLNSALPSEVRSFCDRRTSLANSYRWPRRPD